MGKTGKQQISNGKTQNGHAKNGTVPQGKTSPQKHHESTPKQAPTQPQKTPQQPVSRQARHAATAGSGNVWNPAEALEFMQRGSFLVKVREKGKFRRFYHMEDDFVTLHYNSKKNACKSPDTMMSLTDIQEIREGVLTDVFVKASKKLKVREECCFSLVHGEKHRTLDLVAENKDVRNSWVHGLKHLKKKLSDADLSTQQTVWMRELFKLADKDGDNGLTLKEILNLLKHLNISVDYDTAKQVFDGGSDDIIELLAENEDFVELLEDSADTDKTKNKKGSSHLDMDEFITFYKNLTSRTEIEDLFQKYNYEGHYLEAEELKDFLEKEQLMKVSMEDCNALIQENEPCPIIKSQGAMGIDGFYSFLNSPTCDIFNAAHRKVYQDMDQPFSHYYIDSSHNTYLTSDQLMGDSAVEAYIKALKMGCRCVELDCWDGDKGEPIIYHGHTFTSKIAFKDVIGAVNLYAFESSEYPVILSLENHCSVEQQKLMATYITTTFGDKLLSKPLPDTAEHLPSPNQLKGKIIVKAKKMKSSSGDEDGEVSDEDEAAEINNEDVQKKVKEKSKKKHKLAKELSDIVIICQSVSFKGFNPNIYKPNFKQMSSLGENKAMGLAEEQERGFIDHNRWQITRTYPAGMRTDSSNYNPMSLWLVGCQIVALNYQTPDEPMHINRGWFEDNGGCGYVLKPGYLRKGDEFCPSGPHPDKWRKNLRLKIISGYQLPKKRGDKARSILDPYVKIDILGVPEDTQFVKTNFIKNNGFHPVWNETFDIDVKVPDSALIRFQVLDYQDFRSNVMVAQYCMPFSSLTSGYRYVNLKSKYGEPVRGASLFVHVMVS